MSDGTTAIQVSPITEEDMGKVHDILRRAVDAIVGMSQLSRDVDDMRRDMTQMADELDRLRRTNNALEESLDSSRRHRIELEDKISSLTQIRNDLENGKASAERDAAHYMQSTNGLLDQVATLKRERDDAQFRQMELEDKVTAAEAKLSVIRDLFGAPTPAVQAPEPTPFPTQAPVTIHSEWSPGRLWSQEHGGYLDA